MLQSTSNQSEKNTQQYVVVLGMYIRATIFYPEILDEERSLFWRVKYVLEIRKNQYFNSSW